MKRYVCVHGHFYQPPRENPWLDSIEAQDSAFPYHDWNERVTAECYAQNASSRILDGEGYIARIVNNYERISFNFGPTLLAWMEKHSPEVYAAIIEADRRSRLRFNGHGSALAQVYNHVIMPLANLRDKHTQVVWAIRDFSHRFGRRPEGMWLAETAVDNETLDVLAEHGIAFTILAPNQAQRVRQPDGEWQDVRDSFIDTSVPYTVHLTSGRKITVFFYNGPLSRSVAFEQLLANGDRFANALLESAMQTGEGSRLSHIATDGETFGHHHRFGDMALAYALNRIESTGLASLTNYGDFLAQNPAKAEVEIAEGTSWSCAHGIERWRSDCGCSTGGPEGWRQAWRAPLREALDWLRDRLAETYEREAKGTLTQPWPARNDYINLLLDRSPERLDLFFRSQLASSQADKSRALKLLEMQRQAMLMFASCAWFFNDLAGLETVQVLLHAGRAIQLANELAGDDLEEPFLQRLAIASSNQQSEGNGADIYRRYVGPARVDLLQVGAHFAAAALFRPDANEASQVGNYRIQGHDLQILESGRSRLALGRASVVSDMTLESAGFRFAALHLGDQNLAGAIEAEDSGAASGELNQQLIETFSQGDMTDSLRLIDSQFPGERFSLRSLFKDDQRAILQSLMEPVLNNAEAVYRRLYEDHVSLIRFLASVQHRIPNRLRAATQMSLDLEMRRTIAPDDIDEAHVRGILQQASLAGAALDAAGIALVMKQTLERLAIRFRADPGDSEILSSFLKAVQLVPELGSEIDLWRVQNIFYETVQRIRRSGTQFLTPPSPWQENLEALGQSLRVRVSA